MFGRGDICYDTEYKVIKLFTNMLQPAICTLCCACPCPVDRIHVRMETAQKTLLSSLYKRIKPSVHRRTGFTEVQSMVQKGNLDKIKNTKTIPNMQYYSQICQSVKYKYNKYISSICVKIRTSRAKPLEFLYEGHQPSMFYIPTRSRTAHLPKNI